MPSSRPRHQFWFGLDAHKSPFREVVEVPEDSEDAKKWPRWQPNPNSVSTSTPTESNLVSSEQVETSAVDSASKGQRSASVSQPTASSSRTSDETPPPKPKKRPGPRKSKILDISSNSGPKAKKLTTLDKSLMDWRTHVGSEEQAGSGLKDELEANRRGGGYLEKVEFLQRVGERKEEAFEASKSAKRRRGL